MTMRKTLLSLVTLLASSSLSAQPVDQVRLRDYVLRALPRCAGASLELVPMTQAGPANFQVYRASLNSTDQYCGVAKYVLVSPATQQTIVGTVIVLPRDARPVHVRVAEQASQLLKAKITATIAPLTLPDNLKQVSMTRQTPYGPFSYTGYVDASGNFLLVGMRGSLKEDPGTTLLRTLGIDKSAARRGNSVAKVSIIELSDFQCPSCARAHEKLEPIFAKSLGKISFTRLDLPLFEHHEWAFPAALGARAIQQVAPKKYWAYVDHVFKNQEGIEKMKFDVFFKNWVEDNDIDWKAVEKIYRSKAEQQAVLDSVSRSFSVGINSTPTFVVNGQLVGFGDGTYATEFIRSAIAGK
jgi:protein-disulfide isomerase